MAFIGNFGGGEIILLGILLILFLFFGGIFLGIALFFIKRSERKKENRSNRQ